MDTASRLLIALLPARALLPLILAIACLALPACPKPLPGPDGVSGPTVVDCAADAVVSCGPQALGPVNTCLSSGDGWRDCLVGLIGPAMCAAQEVIYCAVGHSGNTAGASLGLNPDDVVSKRIAERSKLWLEERQVNFAGQTAPGYRPGSAGGGGAAKP